MTSTRTNRYNPWVVKTCATCGEVYGDSLDRCPVDGAGLEPWAQTAERLAAVSAGSPTRTRAPTSGGEGGHLADPPAQQVGEGRLLGERYFLKHQVGVGGFGAVFEAEDRRLQKRVAVKVLSPYVAAHPQTLQRFEREAIAASQVGHEGIVDVTDFGRDPDGTRYIVMEYLNGADLARALAEAGTFTAERAFDVAIQVADALFAAHEKGILHRDLKPANIYLIERAGRADYVKILDFGISKVLAQGEPGVLTATGQTIGTPFYMSPEQATGDRVIDARSDVYALGVILFEVLVGRPPFVGTTHVGVLTQHVTKPPPVPSALRPDLGIPPAIDALIMQALAKDPGARFQSMREMAEAMRGLLAGSFQKSLGLEPRAEGSLPRNLPQRPAFTPEAFAATMATPATGPGHTAELEPALPSLARRSQSRTLAAIAGVLVGLGAIGVWLLSERPSPPPAPQKPVVTQLPPVPAPPGTGAAGAPAPPPTSRRVRIEPTTEGSAAFGDKGQALGVLPLELEVPAGRPFDLELRAPGRVPRPFRIEAGSPAAVRAPELALVRRKERKIRKAKKRGDKSPDIETSW